MCIIMSLLWCLLIQSYQDILKLDFFRAFTPIYTSPKSPKNSVRKETQCRDTH